jgi:hypothetical protein
MNPPVVSTAPQPPEWFLKYVARGFKLIKYPRKSKHPSGADAVNWAAKYVDSPDGYVDDSNWGVLLGTEVEPGKYLADVDFDWADGHRLARRFITPTSFVFGRGERKVTHALYTTSQPTIWQRFEDIDDNTMLVELRGAKKDKTLGLQTMLPPSIHPNGQVVTLQADGEIAHDDALSHRVVLYAIACLLLKHFEHRGLKHFPRLALAGFLLKLKLAEDDVIAVSQAVAEATGNSLTDVVTAVRTTAAKLRAGETNVTGRKALAEAIGENGKKVVARIAHWLGQDNSLQEAIDRLNDGFAIVSVGNKVVVMETWPDGSIKQLWSFDEFKRLQIKNRIPGSKKVINVADLWLTHEDGRRYDRLVYAMPGSAEQCYPADYNGWLGFTVKPESGSWTKNRDHIYRIICAGNDAAFEWLLNWMAALVQWPGRHAFTAIVLRGGQGTGKGHFAHQMLGALFHKQQYLHIIGSGMLTGRFNEHLSGKVLVFADESTWGGDPAAAEKLKGMVTESTVPIERKFLPLVEEPSALHIIIASNNDWPISIPMDDRRFLVLDVADTERQNDSYFGPLRQELANGGLAAMLHDLLAHNIDEHALRHPPNTKAKRQVMLESLKPIERWWFEKLLKGTLDLTIPSKDDDGKTITVPIDGWELSVPKDALHDSYLNFLDKHRDSRTRRSTETELGMFLKKYTPIGAQRRLPGTGQSEQRQRFWDLPSLDECREFWVEKCSWTEDFDWDEEG